MENYDQPMLLIHLDSISCNYPKYLKIHDPANSVDRDQFALEQTFQGFN